MNPVGSNMAAPIIPLDELVRYASNRNDTEVVFHYLRRYISGATIQFPYPHRNCNCLQCSDFAFFIANEVDLVTRDPTIPYIEYDEEMAPVDIYEGTLHKTEPHFKDADDEDLASFSTIINTIDCSSCPICEESSQPMLSMNCCKQCICIACVKQLENPCCPYCRANLD
jgi:hypothetical protein